MRRPMWRISLVGLGLLWLVTVGFAVGRSRVDEQRHKPDKRPTRDSVQNAADKVARGRTVFRFDTFGDEAFWGGPLSCTRLSQARLSAASVPASARRTALAVGLKVDIDALPRNVAAAIESGTINLDDPAYTVALLKLNAVSV